MDNKQKEYNLIMDNNPIPVQAPTQSSKRIPIIIASIILVIGLGVGAYFLFFNKPSQPEEDNTNVQPTDTTTDTTPIASADKPEEERLDDYTREIEMANNDEDRLSLILDNVMVLMEYGHSGEALKNLQSIDVSSLSDYDLYRVYSHFAYVYDVTGDYDSADEYHNLANDAYDRYELSGEQ